MAYLYGQNAIDLAIKAKNDNLIEELLRDTRYQILETGVILKNGVEVGFTRNSEAEKRGKRYRYIRYRGFDLKVNRIVYAKFNGKLDSRKVVHHEDDDSLHNHKDNLKQVTQWQNMLAKGRRSAEQQSNDNEGPDPCPF